jgi:NAD-dependent aldehyde dehydrogenases
MVGEKLSRLGIEDVNPGACYGPWIEHPGGPELISYNPGDGEPIAKVRMAAEEDYDEVVYNACEKFRSWRLLPAPKRGEIVREIGEELRKHKEDLGALVSIESGKILQEGLGEVQEMIDIADFAVGLSRQLHGLTMHSERAGHRMYEQWHPLGVIGVISAFNFPVAVWAWNALLAFVCGDCVVWKPSPETPLTAIAIQKICGRVLERHGWQGVCNLVIGEVEVVGERLLHDRRIPLVSATGSCRMGRRVAEVVGRRLGRTLLELGGNNGLIVMDDANLDLAARAIVFGAVGTAGQRCTSIRRLFLHHAIAENMTARLISIYRQVKIGSPLAPDTLMGPLINAAAVDRMMRALDTIRELGGEILYGGNALGGFYVEPTLVKARHDLPILREEIFAPILYLIEFDDPDTVLQWHNDVPQGLSSALFTNNLSGRDFSKRARKRLRHCEYQYWNKRSGNRRSLWRREGYRRRTRIR